MTNRPSIPADIVRKVLIESGHRCAVCGAPCPLERAHIIPWHKSQEHKVEDLICLCANCHQRADLEKWGEKTLREYKQTPWVMRSAYTESNIQLTTEVELTITAELKDFDEKAQRWLQYALAGFLEISPNAIQITSISKGSVKIILKLPTQSAEKLLNAYEKDDPKLARYLDFLVLLNLRRVGTPETLFDPYPLSLSILSALLAARPLANLRRVMVSELEKDIRRQLYQVSQVIYRSADLVTQFGDFLKANNVLLNEFRPGTSEILINKDSLEATDQMNRTAFWVSRLFPRALDDLASYLAPSEKKRYTQIMSKCGMLLREAMWAPDYHRFVSSLRSVVSYISDFVYEIASSYERDKVRLHKVFGPLKTFEDWAKDQESDASPELPPSELVWRIPIVSSIAAGSGHIGKENIEEYLFLRYDERKGADFGVRVVGGSMEGDGILSGDIALIRQQPHVEIGEIAAVVITTPAESISVLKRYYVFLEEWADTGHWILESSNPSSANLVVIPSGGDTSAIKALYDETIPSGSAHNPIIYFEKADLTIAGKCVGVVKQAIEAKYSEQSWWWGSESEYLD
jgi:SOS-response transcriptional repressor LexA